MKAGTDISVAGWTTDANLKSSNDSDRDLPQYSAVAAASLFAIFSIQTPALSEVDAFQQAVNYVFAGHVEPQDGPEIVDRNNCVVVLHDPKFNRYIRYHLSRFNMGDAIFSKRYSGTRPSYELQVKGDEIVLEYLNPDKKTVSQSYRSAQIPLRGDIDQTQKALQIIFTDYCKVRRPGASF